MTNLSLCVVIILGFTAFGYHWRGRYAEAASYYGCACLLMLWLLATGLVP